MKWTEYRNKILDSVDAEAFYLNELPDGTRHGDSEYKTRCPFPELHEGGTDNSPSFTVNLDTGVYYCNTCHSKGNIHTYYRTKYNKSSKEAWFFFGDALDLARPDGEELYSDTIDPEIALKWHNDLLTFGGNTLDFLLNERGLDLETIKRFQIGWNGERYSIPIYDENYNLVNIRLYTRQPVDEKQKVINYRDEKGNTFGKVRLYGIENITEPIKAVVFAEGELDRLICERHGIPAVTSTSGAGSWDRGWTPLFKNVKRVYACYDNDAAGTKASAKLLRRLTGICEVRILQWPEGFPTKGDLTDYFTAGHNKDDFNKLLASNATTITTSIEDEEEVDDSNAIETTLLHSVDATYDGKRIKMPVMISGKGMTTSIFPYKVLAQCMAQDKEGKMCNYCPLSEGPLERYFKADTNKPLSFIECTDQIQQQQLIHELGIPQKCRSFDYEVVTNGNLEEIRMVPIADTTFSFDKEQEHVVRLGYYMGRNLKSNKRYTLTGYMHHHPKNQRATFIFDKAYPEHDAVTDFKVDGEVKQALDLLKPKPGQSIKEKFDEIHADLEYNITRVWNRRAVAKAVDLIYHTPLHFYFQGQFIKRGWGEALLIGDSGQAKSTVVEQLMRHYNLGEMLSGESSKRTGLTYNMQQNGNSWFLIWGAFPLNDGGLIAVDEFSGMSESDIASLSEIRSSGVCRVKAVVNDETSSRTRAIYISNPRSGRPLASETYGVQAVLKLFGTTEDVRRLDIAVGVASGEVAAELINSDYSKMAEVPHVYTSDVCNAGVMWAWSRTPEQIIIEEAATKEILKQAITLSSKYSSAVPLAEPADMRLKLARLSIAAAARTASTDETYESIIVKPEHVEFIVDFLQSVYDAPALQYDKLSQKEFAKTDTSDDRMTDLRKAFLDVQLMDHNVAVEGILRMDWFTEREAMVQTNTDQFSVTQLLHFMVANNLASDKGRYGYKLTATGATFFKSVQANPYTNEEMSHGM